mmetsp:Transcript_5642/g.9926  ORF Transcript_5642/g.9926 Transcript_5642/m.9926 type:complete len:240 (+) Transcript_5642:115-834(+)
MVVGFIGSFGLRSGSKLLQTGSDGNAVCLNKSTFVGSSCYARLPAVNYKNKSVISMAISEGERIPFTGSFSVRDDSGDKEVTYESVFKDKKVAVCAIPGAFTGTCYKEHAPGFVESAAKFKELGVDEVVIISVNDNFVMYEFGKALGADGKVTMLADGDATFAKKLGLVKETGSFGGTRSARYSMLVSNGVVVKLNVATSGVAPSDAETLLKQMTEVMDPLEKYCLDAPEADECRVYED